MPAVEPILTLRAAHEDATVVAPAVRAVPETLAWLTARGFGLRQLGPRLVLWRERAQPLAGTTVLRFTIDLPDPGFAALADLDAVLASPAPVFGNAGLPLADEVALRLGTRHARMTAGLVPARDGPAAQRFPLPARPAPGTTAADIVPPVGVQVAGLDAAAGLVDLTGPGLRAGRPVALDVPVVPPRPADALAEIELAFDQALVDARVAAGSAADHVIRFAARAPRWCFYVLAPAEVAPDAVVLAAPGGAEGRGLAFAAADARRDLTALPDAGDAVGQALLARQGTAGRVLRFLSDAPVALRAAPIRRIALDIGGRRQFENCPNPRPEAVGRLRHPDGTVSETIHATITSG